MSKKRAGWSSTNDCSVNNEDLIPDDSVFQQVAEEDKSSIYNIAISSL
jgi:hypothetical protein